MAPVSDVPHGLDDARMRAIRRLSDALPTYLSRTRPGRSVGRGRTDSGSGRLVWSWHVVGVLRRPVRTLLVHLRRRVALVLSHVVSLRVVGRVGRRIAGAGLGDGGIYRHVRVRLYATLIVAITRWRILQGY